MHDHISSFQMNISYYKEIEKFQKNVRVFLTIADRAEELSMIPDDFAVYDVRMSEGVTMSMKVKKEVLFHFSSSSTLPFSRL